MPAGSPPPVHADATRLLADPGATSGASGLAGGEVGAWRLLRPIGEGGMGMVWLAERADRAFERQAAVKIIRPGFESAAVQERFLLERQTLGALEHPHIARLLDAGNTADGRPYFVMEYVDGVPIDAWCRDAGLDLQARVSLFLQVCDAVQYAHGRLVVHRDIKPSNLLVDRDGQARLLDFGIAKLLPAADDALAAGLTSASERLLTPQYAAPEQLLGQPVGITTDVYSLGMLLYVLLADTLPYSLAGAGPAEMQRLVCDQVPPKPSQSARDPRRARALRGDLDLITLMALRKEPERRYRTVEQFAADLRRWRDGLPVLAQPDTARYRLRKFVARNRLAIAATVLVFASLVGGIAASLWQAREAERARLVAEQRYRDVRSLATDMMFEVDAAIATLPGASQARRLVVTRALAHLDRLSKEMGSDPDLVADVATGYQKIADIQGSPYDANLGEVAAALGNARTALALREQAAALAPAADAPLAALARSHLQIGVMQKQLSGDETQAGVSYARAAALLEPRLPQAAPDGAVAAAFVEALNLMADAHYARGEHAQAVALHARALARADAALAAATEATVRSDWQRTRAVTRLRLANARWWEGAPGDEVIEQMLDALRGFDDLLAADPANARLTRQVAVANGVVSGVVAYERTLGEARPFTQRALALGERLLAFDPRNALSRRDMARWQSLAADQMETPGYWTEAEGHSRRALALIDELVAEEPLQRDLKVEGRTLRCRHASLLLRGLAKAVKQDAYSKPAVCRQLRACLDDVARDAAAPVGVAVERMQEIERAAGTCPAG
jgi:tetratricopeptide (TPR) repeat protein